MPIAPHLSTLREAQILLRNYFGVTPLVRARSLARADAEAWLKIETGLPTGSFKPRGALFGLVSVVSNVLAGSSPRGSSRPTWFSCDDFPLG